MIKLLILAIHLLLLNSVAADTCEPEVAYSWRAEIGKEFIGNRPLVTKLEDDKIAIGSTVGTEREDYKNMTIQIFNLSGDLIKTCTTEVYVDNTNVHRHVRPKKFMGIGKSMVVVTWLTNDNQFSNKMAEFLTAFVVDIDTCTFHERIIELHNSTALDRYFERRHPLIDPHHSIILGSDGTLELIIWSSVLCGDDVCRINLQGPEKCIKSAQSFVKGYGLNFWRLYTINSNDSLGGYFLVTVKSTKHYHPRNAIITKLDHSGKVLKTIESNLELELGSKLSSGHGHVVLCSEILHGARPECQMFDSSLERKTIVKDLEMAGGSWPPPEITKDNGVVLTTTVCTKEVTKGRDHPPRCRDDRRYCNYNGMRMFARQVCTVAEVRMKKVQPDGNIAWDYRVFDSEARLSLEEFHNSFLNQEEDVYCAIKLNKGNLITYDSKKRSMEVKCLKMLAPPSCKEVNESS